MDRTGWRVVVIKKASRTSRAQLTAILFNRQLLFKLSLSANGNATQRNATQRRFVRRRTFFRRSLLIPATLTRHI